MEQLSIALDCSFLWCPNFRFTLRDLCDLGVPALSNGFKHIHRRDAENFKIGDYPSFLFLRSGRV
jgi:hypothetical protein